MKNKLVIPILTIKPIRNKNYKSLKPVYRPVNTKFHLNGNISFQNYSGISFRKWLIPATNFEFLSSLNGN